jgi:hypothetical protein
MCFKNILLLREVFQCTLEYIFFFRMRPFSSLWTFNIKLATDYFLSFFWLLRATPKLWSSRDSFTYKNLAFIISLNHSNSRVFAYFSCLILFCLPYLLSFTSFVYFQVFTIRWENRGWSQRCSHIKLIIMI